MLDPLVNSLPLLFSPLGIPSLNSSRHRHSFPIPFFSFFRSSLYFSFSSRVPSLRVFCRPHFWPVCRSRSFWFLSHSLLPIVLLSLTLFISLHAVVLESIRSRELVKIGLFPGYARGLLLVIWCLHGIQPILLGPH